MSAITFKVEGMAPAPQGSKRLVARGVMIESCRNVKPWRALVTSAAIATGLPILRGPVSLSVVFLFLRPKGHFTPKGALRSSAPQHHAVKPDGSKLLRSTEDALTGSLLEDDARIVSCTWQKRYCVGPEKPGALITLIPLQKQSP
jgi:Holliday junction resolvase RusA-like endonuclease